MSEQILLLNPRRSHRRRRHARRRGRMPAALARYWASHSRNPRRSHRRRRHHARRVRRYAMNPRRSHHRRRHHRRHAFRMRNPRRRQRGYAMVGAGTSLRPEAILKGIVIPGAVGAVGAVGLDILWGYASPTISANFPSLSTGWLGLFVKLGVIGAVAYGARRLRPQWGRQIQNGAIGAAVLTLYTGVKGALQSVLPSTVPGLSGYMDFQSYALPRGMGAYMSRGGGLGDLSDMFSPAAVIQPMGTPVPRQFGEYMIPQRGMAGYIAAQPHVAGVGSGGLMGYDWQNDGM